MVGLLRGRLTTVWAAPDGHVYSQGTWLTIGLFLGLVVAKFAMGAAAYILHISDDGGFGEILFMIAIMVALRPNSAGGAPAPSAPPWPPVPRQRRSLAACG